ncbi:MAG: hypothetical protein ABR985_01460 [Methanotrichaceae archaeon]|jgi:hypothetical protein
MATFSEIHDAFLFVSSEEYGMHSAILCKDTGRIYYRSELGGIDEIDEADLDLDTCIDIPHKNDLDLGQKLVYEFVERHLSDEYHIVQQIFRYRGAYARFKALLEQKGLLQSWFDFENHYQELELRQWCMNNEIILTD